MTNILITGASSGLGEEMAKQFAAQGANLALVARRGDRLLALKNEIEGSAKGLTVLTRELDITDAEAVPTIFAQLDEEIGGFDRIIVNAGIGKGAPLGTGKAYANIETMSTNLIGALIQIEAALALFRQRNAGHLVLISSMSAVRGMPKALAAYSASKAGLSALGEGLQTEFAGTPIKVTTLLPGYIATDMSQGLKTTMMTECKPAVAAMVKAINKESERAVIPGWPWRGVDFALRHLPPGITRKFI